MGVPFITEDQTQALITEKDAFRLTRETFDLIAAKKVHMPPKMYLVLDNASDFRAMPAYVETSDQASGGACGIKWISVFSENAQKNQPTVIGTILLNSSETGRLLAVLEANTITAMRTAATAAVAASLMAIEKPKVLAVVGAGLQAGFQLKAHTDLFNFEEMRVWGYFPGEAEAFCAKHASFKNLKVVGEIRDCVKNADIIITCTSSRKPLIQDGWIKPGAHINAIGADAKGKQEIDPMLVQKACVVVDEWQQASHSGEINVPVSLGLFSKDNLYGELAEIVSGQKKGKRDPAEITLFDSTGLAALDIYFADFVYKKLSAPGKS